jgi:hypothetical protein
MIATRYALRSILATILCLLAIASAAHAECAWVLWSAPGTTDPRVPLAQAAVTIVPSNWQPIRAYETPKACEAALSDSQRDEFAAMLKRDKPGATVLNSYAYRCLPDAVDPRVPNGK